MLPLKIGVLSFIQNVDKELRKGGAAYTQEFRLEARSGQSQMQVCQTLASPRLAWAVGCDRQK